MDGEGDSTSLAKQLQLFRIKLKYVVKHKSAKLLSTLELVR